MMKSILFLSLSLLLLAMPVAAAAETTAPIVTLMSVQPSGEPVGATVVLLATTTGITPNNVRYRFRIGETAETMSTVRAFSPLSYFQWTPMTEGTYQIEVTAQDITKQTSTQATISYTVVSRLSTNEPVLTATEHPLIFLYSAPACTEAGSQMRIFFRPVGTFFWTLSPWRDCSTTTSNNLYVAGMRAETRYEVRHQTRANAATAFGPTLQRKTGEISKRFPDFKILKPVDGKTSLADGVLLQSINTGIYDLVFPVATDLFGRVLWYYEFREYENPVFPWNAGSYLVQPLEGGNMLLFLNYDGQFDFFLREVDLAGKVVRETNIEAVNRQLQALGQDTIGFFHHEAIRLPNGHTLVLGSVERIYNDVQGVQGEINILGDMVIDLDENLEVSWVWNAFEHLDVERKAVLNEVCTIVTVGCPPISKGLTANDWTHTNTIYPTPDGGLLLSLRHQDWILKIDYQNGEGSGEVLWRFGQDGDFSLQTEASDPWFSHQHDVTLVDGQMVVYDNGNTRCDGQPASANCHSRGQVYELDEATLTAKLVVNADLGHYSNAFGSAKKLSNGNYHFLSGVILPSFTAQSVEVTPAGEIAFVLQTQGLLYRSYRMATLYSPDPYLVPGDEDGVVDLWYLPAISK